MQIGGIGWYDKTALSTHKPQSTAMYMEAPIYISIVKNMLITTVFLLKTRIINSFLAKL